MTLEKTVAKATTDVTQKALKTAETGIHKAWSILDAATEKMEPSEQISQDAIKKIQGKSEG